MQSDTFFKMPCISTTVSAVNIGAYWCISVHRGDHRPVEMEALNKKPVKKLAKKRKKFGKKKNVETQEEEVDTQREDEEKMKLVASLMKKCDLTEKEVSLVKS